MPFPFGSPGVPGMPFPPGTPGVPGPLVPPSFPAAIPTFAPSSAEPVVIRIIGGSAYPEATRTSYVQYLPGMTIRQALALTGQVTFGPDGGIVAVPGVPVRPDAAVRLHYNGSLLPESMLDYPADPGGTVLIELHSI